MSFFARIFGRTSEHKLLDLYSQIWGRMQRSSAEAARKEVAQWIAEEKREAQRDGDAKFPPNYGDVLLSKENTDPHVRRVLAIKRAEGVTDADIRWWWNLNYIERRLMLRIDNLSRIAVFTEGLAKQQTPDEVARHVWKYFPNYGNEQEVSAGQGDDRPIPYELKDRINSWLEKQRLENPLALKRRLEEASIFNAVVRLEIHAGRI